MEKNYPDIYAIYYGINPKLDRTVYRVDGKIGHKQGCTITQITCDTSQAKKHGLYEFSIFAKNNDGNDEFLAKTLFERPSEVVYFQPDGSHIIGV